MSDPLPSNPLDDTQEIPAVSVPPQRRPAIRSRKFWCVVVMTLIPFLNWITVQMPVDHVLATMFPWAAWGGGEWALDLLKLARELRRVPSE